MVVKDLAKFIFAMTADEIDDLEYYWQNEDAPKLEDLLTKVMQRLEIKGQ